MSLKRWNGAEWVVVAGSRPGPQGPQGTPGRSSTVTLGNVVTGPEGSPVIITNTGDGYDAVLNFTLPGGAQGPAGLDGVDGAQGPAGPQGVAGQRGSYNFTGIADPTLSNPASPNGLDNYLNTTTGDWFQYDSSSTSWVLQGNLTGPQGIQGITGDVGPVGPSGNEVANEILDETKVARIDAMLNLGIYYPKYTSTLTQVQLNSRFAASSFLF
jgi:hypothetical protein